MGAPDISGGRTGPLALALRACQSLGCHTGNGMRYLSAELRESCALIREGGVIHDVPVKYVELVISHDVLGSHKRATGFRQTHPRLTLAAQPACFRTPFYAKVASQRGSGYPGLFPLDLHLEQTPITKTGSYTHTSPSGSLWDLRVTGDIPIVTSKRFCRSRAALDTCETATGSAQEELMEQNCVANARESYTRPFTLAWQGYKHSIAWVLSVRLATKTPSTKGAHQ